MKKSTKYCIFLHINLLKMSCRKRWKWHFQVPKIKNFLGEHALGWHTVATTFLPSVCTHSKSHATPLKRLIRHKLNSNHTITQKGINITPSNTPMIWLYSHQNHSQCCVLTCKITAGHLHRRLYQFCPRVHMSSFCYYFVFLSIKLDKNGRPCGNFQVDFQMKEKILVS